ncbi:MAG: hypothetical protein R3C20_00890 [Planctomycetaceae bacterium]
MGRLGILLCFALTTSSSGFATAQHSTGVPGVSGEFVVGGDVANPHAYTIASPNRVVHLRDAVAQAGLLADFSTVLVLPSGNARGQWTHFISPSSSDPGPEIKPGYILMVYGQSLRQAAVPNAVFIQNGIATPVTLEDGVRIGDVFHSFGITTPATSTRIVSANSGRTQNNAALTSPVMHGDIIIAGNGQQLQAGGRPTRGFQPQVTEWRSNAMSDSSTHEMPSPQPTEVSLATASAVDVPGQDSDQPSEVVSGFHIPLLSTPTDRAVADLTTQGGDSFREDGQNELTANASETAIDQSALRPASLQILPPDPIDEAGSPVVRMNEAGIELPVTETAADTAPIPPVQRSGSMAGLWNAIFVVGLLLAGLLIIGGWLKSEAEMRSMHASAATDLQTQLASIPVSENRHQGSGAVASQYGMENPARAYRQASDKLSDEDEQFSSSSLASLIDCTTGEIVDDEVPTGSGSSMESAQSAPSLASTIEVESCVTSADPMVKPEEWFSGDWIPNVVSARNRNQSQSGAVVQSEAHVAIDTWAEQNGTMAADKTEFPQVDSNESGENQNSIDPVSVEEHLVTMKHDESETSETVLGGFAAENPEMISGFEALTDLIENRLPIDLCDAALPLRVNLFGTPAGPRRLRIDSAHTSLSGPHFSINSDIQQQSPEMVGAMAQQDQAGRQSSHAQNSTSVDSAATIGTDDPGAKHYRTDAGESAGNDGRMNSMADSGSPVKSRSTSLDRALNYLNEQKRS